MEARSLKLHIMFFSKLHCKSVTAVLTIKSGGDVDNNY